jgi:hypothetical protein
MIHEHGDWTQYRSLPNLVEIDFHRGRRDRSKSYWECMAEVREEAEQAIRQAYDEGRSWLLIGHGQSTSRPFHTTARSVIRRLVRDKSMTPYILRAQSICHPTCMAVRLRPRPSAPSLQGERGGLTADIGQRQSAPTPSYNAGGSE